MNDFIGRELAVGDYVAYVMVGNGHLHFGKICAIGAARVTVINQATQVKRIVLPTNVVRVDNIDATVMVLKT